MLSSFDIIRVLAAVCDVGAIVLNAILFPLILKRSSAFIGNYKYLLLLIVVHNIVHHLGHCLTLPVFITNEVGWVYMSTTKWIPSNISTVIVMATGGITPLLGLILAYSFLFRYGRVVNPTVSSFFKSACGLPLLTFLYILLAIVSSMQLWNYFSTTLEFQARQNLILIQYNLRTTGHIGISLYHPNGTLDVEHSAVLACWTGIFVLYSIIYIYFALHLFTELRKSSKWSPAARKHHRQLFYLLIAQAATPLVFSYIPVLVSHLLTFWRVNSCGYSYMYSYFTTLVGAVDAVIMFVLIPIYKDALLDLLPSRTKITVINVVPQ